MKRLVIGGATIALVSAMAVLAPTGATASGPDTRPATGSPSGPGARPDADARADAARAAARLVASKPETFKASRHDRFVAGRGSQC